MDLEAVKEDVRGKNDPISEASLEKKKRYAGWNINHKNVKPRTNGQKLGGKSKILEFSINFGAMLRFSVHNSPLHCSFLLFCFSNPLTLSSNRSNENKQKH